MSLKDATLFGVMVVRQQHPLWNWDWCS